MDAEHDTHSNRGLWRVLRHLSAGVFGLRRRFNAEVMDRISTAVGQAEAGHAGEIRFAVEAGLPLHVLLARSDPRTRAVAWFSQLRLWDTQDNTGVLLYLQWPDQAIEIVVDRGICELVPQSAWQSVCDQLRARLAQGDAVDDAVCACILAIGELLRIALPPAVATPDELPNAPILL